MFKNYLKTAYRNIKGNLGHSFINIAGLAIGIACCIAIFLFVQHELSYDRYHENAERIYRIGLHGVIGATEFNGIYTCSPLAQTLVNDFPEVARATRIFQGGYPVVRYGEKVFSEERFFWADSTLFEVFTIPLLEGEPGVALNKPGTVIISRAMQDKYFGDESGMGKIITTDNRRDYTVTGIMENFPKNSHFHFDFIGSLATYAELSQNPLWVSNSVYTYILLEKNSKPEQLESKFPNMVRKYVSPQIQAAAGITYDQMVEIGGAWDYFLQPITDIHLKSDLDNEIEPGGNIAYVNIFSVIAIALLLIACINFMNLATARSAGRAREVGIRKTVGSTRSQLIGQFLAETIVVSLISIFFAIIIFEVLKPTFNMLAGMQLAIHYLGNFLTIPALVGFGIVVGVLAGLYPALFLASFRPVNVIRGSVNLRGQNRSPWLRSGLVIFQFTASVAILIGTFVVGNQVSYIKNKDLGFNQENLILVQKTDDLGPQITAFKQELLQNANIIGVSNAISLPGHLYSANAHKLASAGGDQTHVLWDSRTDVDFVTTFGIEMVAGRYFSAEFPTDSSAAVINEATARALGIDDAIGEELEEMGPTPDRSNFYTIIGVMKDFHFESMHQVIRPMVIKLMPRGGVGRYTLVRVQPENRQETIAFIENTWRKFAGAQAFEYVYFEDDFATIYKPEQQTGNILNLFSVLTFIIACLGLFGLASFTAEQRTKEIGIRKVLGSSVAGIIVLFSKQFSKWVLIGNIIAWPIAYVVMRRWLQGYAYQTNLNVLIFIYAAILSLVIAWLTVSYQSIKAALANPVDALKYE